MTGKEILDVSFEQCRHTAARDEAITACEACLISAIDAAIAEAVRREREAIRLLIKADPDNYTIQSCCICYGGDSFPTKIKEVLKGHSEILDSKIRQRGTP